MLTLLRLLAYRLLGPDPKQVAATHQLQIQVAILQHQLLRMRLHFTPEMLAEEFERMPHVVNTHAFAQAALNDDAWPTTQSERHH